MRIKHVIEWILLGVDWHNIMMEIVVIGRGLRPLLLIVTLLKLIASEAEIPETVNRRQNGDIYTHYNSSSTFACRDDNNLTYFVSERKCVKNQQLINGNL